jgi:hypothetical protein
LALDVRRRVADAFGEEFSLELATLEPHELAPFAAPIVQV